MAADKCKKGPAEIIDPGFKVQYEARQRRRELDEKDKGIERPAGQIHLRIMNPEQRLRFREIEKRRKQIHEVKDDDVVLDDSHDSNPRFYPGMFDGEEDGE